MIGTYHELLENLNPAAKAGFERMPNRFKAAVETLINNGYDGDAKGMLNLWDAETPNDRSE